MQTQRIVLPIATLLCATCFPVAGQNPLGLNTPAQTTPAQTTPTPTTPAQTTPTPTTPAQSTSAPTNQTKPTTTGTETPAGTTTPGAENFTTLRNRVEQSQLADEEKSALLEAIAQGEAALTGAADFEGTANGYQTSLQNLQQRIDQAKEDLQSLTDFKPTLPDDPVLEELEAMLPQLTAQLATAKSELTDAEAAAALATKRRQEIETTIPTVEQSLTERRNQIESAVATDTDIAALVQREGLVASEKQLAAQLNALRNEAALIDAETAADFAQLNRDLQSRTVETLQQQIEAVQTAIAQARAEDAAQRVETAESQLDDLHPALRPIGEQNQEFAEDNRDLANSIAQVEQDLAKRTTKLEEIKLEFQQAKTRVNTVGLTEAVGAMLRTLKANLPNIREYQLRLRERQPLINDAQYKLIDLSDRRNARIDQTVRQLFNEAETPIPLLEQDVLATEARQLLEEQRTEYLNPLIRSQTTYFNTLVSLSTTEQQIIDLVVEATDYVNERVLWVRSTRPLSAQPLPSEQEWWFLRAGAWTNLVPNLVSDLKRRWVRWAIALLALLALVRFRFRLRREIDKIGKEVSRSNFTDFMPTVHSMLITMATAGPLTLVLAFVGFRLRSVAGADPATTAVSSAMITGALTYFPLESLRQICRRNGLAIAHFGRSEENVNFIRTWMEQTMWVMMPAVMLISFLRNGALGFGSDVLGRYVYIAATVFLAFMMSRLLSPRRGVPKNYLQRHPNGWANRLYFVWYFGSIAIPLTLGLLAVLGYYFTAQQLTWRLYLTICLLVITGLIVALVLRWVLLRRRELMIAEAKKKREQQPPSDEAGSEVPIAATEDAAEELRQQMVQTRRLLNAVMAAAVVIGMWWIWSDVLTARGQLEAHPLWTSTTTETETKVDPQGDVVTLTKTVVDNVTLADLAFALLVVAITILATRNIPGLLEFAVLRKLPLDSSIRYAISALSSYAIAMAGLVVSGQAIGLHWDQIQWMATALTFGLAFGLQEMFANFVAGIIILFEQPVRVGDIVEIDGVTGVVSKIRIRATTVTDWNRKDYIVPNKEFITGKILNWTRSDDVSRIVINVGVAYGSDTERARELLLQIVHDHPVVLKEPAPLATFEGFGDSTLNFVLRFFVASPSQRLGATHDIHTAIDKAFKDADIEIAFPQRDLYLRGIPESVEKFLGGEKP